MRTREVLRFILGKMQRTFNLKLTKPREGFLCEAFRVLLALQGRATFTNMARFSVLRERTFRRHYERALDWIAFNLTIADLQFHPEEPCIGVFDTTFIEKAGKKTYGLDRFFSSKERRQRRGLELSLVASVGTRSRHCVGLDATQTPPGLERAAPEYNRADFYLEQITDCLRRGAAFEKIRYWVGDGFYAKAKFFDVLRSYGRHLITRLRSDANLRFLAAPGERGPTGRRRRYAGKVYFDTVSAPESRFEEVGALDDYPHVRLYTALVNSPRFKRDLRIVVLRSERDGSYVVLATSDLEQMPGEVVTFFRLRYQIELLIRDAKQHTGLTECQARDEAKLDFHFNLSMAAVNVGRVMSQRQGLSLASFRREQYNRLLMERLGHELGSDAEFDVRHPGVQRVIQTGRIAA